MGWLDFLKDDEEPKELILERVLEPGMFVSYKNLTGLVVRDGDRVVVDFSLFMNLSDKYKQELDGCTRIEVDRKDVISLPLYNAGLDVYALIRNSRGRNTWVKSVVDSYDRYSAIYTCVSGEKKYKVSYFNVVGALQEPPKFNIGANLRYLGQFPATVISIIVKNREYVYGLHFKRDYPKNTMVSHLNFRLSDSKGAWVSRETLMRGRVPVLFEIDFIGLRIYKANRRIYFELNDHIIDSISYKSNDFKKAYLLFKKCCSSAKFLSSSWIIMYRITDDGDFVPIKVYLPDIDFNAFVNISLGNCFKEDKVENYKVLSKRLSNLFKAR